MQRAIREAKEALEAKGYELVPFEITTEEMDIARDTFLGLIGNYFMGPLAERMNEVAEYPMESYNLTLFFFKTNFLIRELFKLGLNISGNSRVAKSLRTL